ncbi:MAG: ribbon-helix-helix domain-containing protein [Armatimonadota bacterium]
MAVKIVNISLPEKLLKEIDREARKEGRTRSEFLREIVQHYIEAKRVGITTSRTDLERRMFAESSATSFNRIWDNPVDAEVWDNWEGRHGKGKKVKAR